MFFSGFSLVTSKNVHSSLSGSACPHVRGMSTAGELPVSSFWARSEIDGEPTGSDTPRLVCTVERLNLLETLILSPAWLTHIL